MIQKEKRKEASRADLAKASLMTVTNNIGAIARMCASIVVSDTVLAYNTIIFYFAQGVEKVVFVGNYLCNNELSMRLLAFAMEYWSQGSIRALFLEHEGYFGALGSMLQT